MSFGLFAFLGQLQEWVYYPAAAGSIDGRINPSAEMLGELTCMVAENTEGLVLIYLQGCGLLFGQGEWLLAGIAWLNEDF